MLQRSERLRFQAFTLDRIVKEFSMSAPRNPLAWVLTRSCIIIGDKADFWQIVVPLMLSMLIALCCAAIVELAARGCTYLLSSY